MFRHLPMTVLAAACSLFAQQTQEQLRQLRDAKFAQPAFTQLAWERNWDHAKSKAKERDTLILIYLTRSHTRQVVCEKIEQTVLVSPEFKELAARVVLFAWCDSKCDDEAHKDLPLELGYQSLPWLAFHDADGAPLNSPRVPWVPHLLKAERLSRRFVAIRHDLGVAAERERFFLEVEMHRLFAPQLRKQLARIADITPAEQQLVDAVLVDLELLEICREREKSQATCAEQVAVMAKAGRRPTSEYATMFWVQTLIHARNAKDGPLADTAFASLQQEVGDDPDHKVVLEQWRRMRSEARGEKAGSH